MSNIYFSEVAEWYLAEPSTKYGKPKSETAHRRIGEMVDFWGRRFITQIDDKAVERFFNHIKSLEPISCDDQHLNHLLPSGHELREG